VLSLVAACRLASSKVVSRVLVGQACTNDRNL